MHSELVDHVFTLVINTDGAIEVPAYSSKFKHAVRDRLAVMVFVMMVAFEGHWKQLHVKKYFQR